jgi:group I intron endonuclease
MKANNNISFVPVIIYNNVDTDKLKILKDNRGKAGIYKWTHKESGKSYIGSSVNLSRRFREYFNFNKISKGNMNINKALLKYGYSGFQLEILEYCEISDTVLREQYYINLLVPEYNILNIAGSSLGYKHSEQTRLKISSGNKGNTHTVETKTLMSEVKAGENNPMYGKAHNEESLALIKASRIGRTHSEETRNKIGKSLGTQVMVKDIETETISVYDSKRKAAQELKTSLDTVRKYIISKKVYKDKYLIEEFNGNDDQMI